MATKMLNLDEIETGFEKSFVHKGVTHTMKPLSVGDYVKQMKRLDQMQKTPDLPMDEQVAFMVDAVTLAFPSLTKADVESMDFAKIQLLTEFINAEAEDETEEGNVN